MQSKAQSNWDLTDADFEETKEQRELRLAGLLVRALDGGLEPEPGPMSPMHPGERFPDVLLTAEGRKVGLEVTELVGDRKWKGHHRAVGRIICRFYRDWRGPPIEVRMDFPTPLGTQQVEVCSSALLELAERFVSEDRSEMSVSDFWELERQPEGLNHFGHLLLRKPLDCISDPKTRVHVDRGGLLENPQGARLRLTERKDEKVRRHYPDGHPFDELWLLIHFHSLFHEGLWNAEPFAELEGSPHFDRVFLLDEAHSVSVSSS